MEKVGSVEGWTDTLNAMIAGVQQSLNAAMQNAAESFYAEHAASAAAGVTITQQNTFNTPVESPADTAPAHPAGQRSARCTAAGGVISWQTMNKSLRATGYILPILRLLNPSM